MKKFMLGFVLGVLSAFGVIWAWGEEIADFIEEKMP